MVRRLRCSKCNQKKCTARAVPTAAAIASPRPRLASAGWLISAQGVTRGRRWGATLGTVLFGIDTIAVLFVLVGAWGAPVAKSLSVVVWAVGLVTIVCLWGQASRAFYRAFR